ncbi:hypothetical protein QAD02_006921 [Eretmocerus hayati]|uniref:Uncharacterized protein n=1 Tax=Eretmocerus hayati TaxID=131215 RepID=A0ACC2N257_9HYME|nr:hypothetical protein QAD02_006921 [Eretmocerus hayati]
MRHVIRYQRLLLQAGGYPVHVEDESYHYNAYYFSGKDKSPTVSNVRRAASQYCAIAATCVLIISYGLSIGYTTMLIGAVKDKNEPDFIVSEGGLSWIGSLSMFTTPVGAVLSGNFSQLVGRRGLMRAMALPMATTWLLFYLSSTGSGQVWLIFVALGLQGLIMGLIESPTQIYVTEISDPRLRGSVSAVISSTISLGVLLQTILGSFMHWSHLALVNGVLALIALFAMGLVPESPYWLLRKGQVRRAKESLSWLRGWVNPNLIDPTLRAEFESMLTSSNHEYKPTSTTSISKKRSCFETFASRYLRREVYLPFSMVCFTFIISCFTGPSSILPYAVPVFRKLHSPLDDYLATALYAGLQLIAVMLVVPVVPLVGKRFLTFFSLIAGALANFFIAAYVFLGDEKFIQGNSGSWLPTAALLLSVFSFGIGIRTTPWILAGEVFPADVRTELAGVAGCVCTFASAVASKFFIDQMNLLGTPGCFFSFALVNILGLVVLWPAMPHTDGLSLSELEKLYIKDDDTRAIADLHRDNEFEFKDVKDIKV